MKLKNTLKTLGLAGCAAVYASAALAQTIPGFGQLPGAADPTKIAPEATDIEVPRADEQAKPKTVVEGSTEIGKDEQSFVLKKITFQRATAYRDSELKQIAKLPKDRRVNRRTLEVMADLITARYRDDGYFLSKATLVELSQTKGEAIILVTEGFAAEVELQNNGFNLEHDRLGIIEETIHKIKTMQPLHGPTLERYMLLLNDMAGLNASITIHALENVDTAEVGAVGLQLTLAPSARRGEISVNNTGSKYVGPWQTTAQIALPTPITSLDSLSLDGSTANPAREIKFVRARYSVPLTAEGLTLELAANNTDSKPGDSLRDFQIESASSGVSVATQYPFIRSRSENLYGRATFDVRNSVVDAFGDTISNDRTRAVRLNGNYNNVDTYKGKNSLSTTFSQGVDVFGARESGSNNLSRPNGRSNFSKLEASISRLQQLSDLWSVYAASSGQWAFSQLLSSEQYGFGGTGFGRGYDPSEVLGDHGVSASLELRYQESDLIADTTLQPFAFYDIGRIWNIDNAALKRASGTSLGAGVRFAHDSGVAGALYAAIPLTRPANNPPYGAGKDARVMFELSYGFTTW